MSEKRSKLIKLLIKNNISYGIHYPKAIHQLAAFKNFFKRKFKNSEELAYKAVSLPIDPNLRKREILKICQIINQLD